MLYRALPLVALVAACGTNTITLPPPGDASAADAPAADDAPFSTDVAPPPTDVPPAPDAAPADAAVMPDPPVMVGDCDVVRPGMVTGFMVDGQPRSFILTVPTAAGEAPSARRWPVVFNWHGYGDSAPNMNRLLAPVVDNPTMPFILVTPVSTMLGPFTMPVGLDWEQLSVRNPNREAHLFDAVVQCLDRRYRVDADRVYTVGFSAGAILSNLLGTIRGDRLAAVAAFSGAYFNNSANTAGLGILRGFVSWPDFTHARRYPELLVYGGMRDAVSLGPVQARFDAYAGADIPFLRARGHDVIDCGHGGAHTIPVALTGNTLVAFFAAHPRTVRRSPWAAALPMGWPSYCAYRAGM